MAFTPAISLVLADQRGEIFSISLPDNREMMLLHSVKGSKRGGHSHTVQESVMVLTGKMRYHKKGRDGRRLETNFVLEAGQESHTAAGVVHMAEFLEDTWLIELKDAKIGEWEQNNYQPWRDLVEGKHG